MTSRREVNHTLFHSHTGLKNVIYGGIPHGNAKLAYSEIILVLNPIPFFL